MKRIFEPTRKYIGNTNIKTSVDRWEWTKSSGLRVFYKEGYSMKSDYTLRELLGKDKPEGEIRERIPHANHWTGY